MIDYTKMSLQPGMVAFLDFEKAFDSIEWDFIEKALLSIGFGDNFVNGVRILHTDITSSILNNGYTTEQFNLKRGSDRVVNFQFISLS